METQAWHVQAQVHQQLQWLNLGHTDVYSILHARCSAKAATTIPLMYLSIRKERGVTVSHTMVAFICMYNTEQIPLLTN